MKWIKNFGIKADILTIYSLALGQKFIRKVYGLSNCVNYKYVDGEEFRAQRYLEKLNSITKKDIKKWVKIVVNRLSRISDDFEKFCKKEKEYKSDLDLFRNYWEFFEKYSYFAGVCDMPVFLDQAVSERILEEIENKIKNRIDEYFRILTVYLKDTHVNEEEKAMLKIAANFARGISQKLLTHQKKYSWMGYKLLLGKELDKAYFLQKIKNHSKTAKKELEKILLKQKEQKKLFNQAVEKFNLDRDLLKCGQMLIWIRDKRYIGLTRGAFYKRDLFKKIAQKFNLKTDDIFYLLPEEIKDIFLKKKRIDKNLIHKRKNGFAILLLKGKISKPIIGAQLKKIKKEKIRRVNIIKGKPANLGRACGKVRVVFEIKDLSGFKNGEILVTNMTTPDYFSAMKEAAAIVTDLGGITCHAAIISRELDKPCIIATQNATRILKTGDVVEVDAEKGVVKVIKK